MQNRLLGDPKWVFEVLVLEVNSLEADFPEALWLRVDHSHALVPHVLWLVVDHSHVFRLAADYSHLSYSGIYQKIA